ncbi:DUF1206 domain-containing protein [Modestobacter marinus]|uniref:p-aminobenzoyl-glutamate transporter AbgT n=1 Tax=Modestobacter marinus TaxID=477641 RepID=A0A846LRK4_9ACTN|nr:DUF1206 domain-containing protein [Modestobacter marinus]NIH68175.1 p-aminobenzoyl-glutamate transporter AbgT [Modestobacter marinus]GGL79733.1 hypothetical protein GCM10011589_39950 [Modestobacter marinus]
MGTSGTAARADQAGSSDTLEHLARVGLVAYGIVHLLLAWLSLQLAWGGSGDSADQSGAMATLAEQPFGKPLLWVLAAGLIALALWQLAEVLRHRAGLHGSGDARKDALATIAKAIAKTVIYLVLAYTAIRFATGGGQSGSGQEEQTVAGVLGWPGGRYLVGAAALALLGVGAYLVHKGVTKRFLKEIDTADASATQRRLIERLGQVGYPAKGVALAVVGGLLGWAAITFDADKAGGLDDAMHTVLSAPFGQALLTLVALGIAAFGVFCLFRARFPERT